MNERNWQELFDISKNLDAIVIIDFVPNDKLKEFDQNFKKFLGYEISVGNIPLAPWIPIEYSAGSFHVGKDKGIPEGISGIQLKLIKHIGGVAEEILCICKIDKEAFEKLFDKVYEEDLRRKIYGLTLAQIKGNVDYSDANIKINKVLERIDLTEKYNFNKEFVFDFKELTTLLKNTEIKLVLRI